MITPLRVIATEKDDDGDGATGSVGKKCEGTAQRRKRMEDDSRSTMTATPSIRCVKAQEDQVRGLPYGNDVYQGTS